MWISPKAGGQALVGAFPCVSPMVRKGGLMKIYSYEKHGFMIFRIDEIIHLNSNISHLESMAENAAKAGYTFIAVTFPAQSELSSLSIATLVKCGFKLQDMGGQFAVLHPNRQIFEIIRDLELHSVIATAKDEEALWAIKYKAG
jgi:hypothetical protein